MDRGLLRNVLIIFLLYSLTLLFIGSQLSFIPKVNFGSAKRVHAADIRKSVLEKFLKEEKGSYSIYYKDLKTGEEFGIDENKVHTAASLNKLPIVAYLYNQASRGKLDLEDRVTVQEKDVQDYGTGSIRYEAPGGSYSLKNLTKLALEQSDNTAAYVLGVKLGVDNVQEYIRGLGLVATHMNNNETTAKEMGILYDLLNSRKVANEALTRELLDFSRDTDFEDRIARDLPNDAIVYHKAADGVGFVHDAGIISSGTNKFILTILTSDIKNEEEVKNTMGKIAKFIYDQGR